MIRLIIGLLVVMGGVGGIEMDTATLLQGVALSIVGLALMAWPVFDGSIERQSKGN